MSPTSRIPRIIAMPRAPVAEAAMHQLVLALALVLGLSACIHGGGSLPPSEPAPADVGVSTQELPGEEQPAEPAPLTGLEKAAAWLEAHRDRPTMLRAFVERMPKGADLHMHLNGSIYAESFIRWAADEGMCVNRMTGALTDPPCRTREGQVAARTAFEDPELYETFIDMVSTRNLERSPQSGHARFFAAFSKVRGVGADGDKIAELAARAADEHVQYLEIMLTLREPQVAAIGRKIGFDTDLASTRQALLAAGLAEEVSRARAELDSITRRARTTLGCDSSEPGPGCDVEWRILQQTIRTLEPAEVYAQLVFAFELARGDARVVGINIVAPEDSPVALRDCRRHMAMIGSLSRAMPEVGVAVHAGELWPGLVPPRYLRSHIREAVTLAQARRIGHGVDLAYEDDPPGLLELMRERSVLLEACLTSNRVILGVAGDEHPLEEYLRAGVPVALASDDEGVLRTSLGTEYLLAVTEHGLGYGTLVQMARDSLSYSFVEGDGLWTSPRRLQVADACAADHLGSDEPTPACAALLASDTRARLQWRLEAELEELESLPWITRQVPE